jgi:hypothetical protein
MFVRDAVGQGRFGWVVLSTGGTRSPGAAPATRLAASGAWEGPVGNPGWVWGSLRRFRLARGRGSPQAGSAPLRTRIRHSVHSA